MVKITDILSCYVVLCYVMLGTMLFFFVKCYMLCCDQGSCNPMSLGGV